MLARARAETGLAIVTEVMCEDDVPLVAEYADILQIGSRSMENYTLLEAAARSGRPILLKRGMVATVADLSAFGAGRARQRQSQRDSVRARASAPLRRRLRNTFDVAAIALIKQISHLPIIADPSHAAGHRELVPALARVGVAAGADGLIVEVHPNPDKAWSDGEQSLELCRVRHDDGFARALSRCTSPCLAAGVQPAGGRGMSVQARVPGLIACTAAFFSSVVLDPILRGRIGSDLVVTAAPVYDPLAALRGQERFPKGAQIARRA